MWSVATHRPFLGPGAGLWQPTCEGMPQRGTRSMKNATRSRTRAVGCYLMVPPPTLKSFPNPVDKTQPLSGWQKIGQFDREHDCHRALKQLVYEGEKPGDTPATLLRQAVSGDLAKSWWAQCIGSDDPRLAKWTSVPKCYTEPSGSARGKQLG